MPRLPLLALAVLALTPFAARSQSPDTAAVRQQIEANDAAVGRAIHTGDFATLAKLWSPDMIVNNPANRIVTREDVFGFIRHGELNYAHLSTVIEAFKVMNDIAIVMGHEDFTMAEGPSAGKPLVRRYTDVWRHQGDTWVEIARQATVLNATPADIYGPSSAH